MGRKRSNGLKKVSIAAIVIGMIFVAVGLLGYFSTQMPFLFGIWQDIFVAGLFFFVIGIASLIINTKI